MKKACMGCGEAVGGCCWPKMRPSGAPEPGRTRPRSSGLVCQGGELAEALKSRCSLPYDLVTLQQGVGKTQRLDDQASIVTGKDEARRMDARVRMTLITS